MLCGVPGSGKSTWTSQFVYSTNTSKMTNEDHNKTIVLSTDNIIDIIALQYKLTYNEVFDDISYSFAEKIMHKVAKYAFGRADVVIWDQTNLTPKSRAKKLAMVPNGWIKTAVVLKTPDYEELYRRLSNRHGKIIPDNVIRSMLKNYIKPTKDEGFDHILEVV